MNKKYNKEYSLNVVEEVVYGDMAKTHAGGRIEIHENDKKYHKEEIRFLLPREMFLKLKEKLQWLKF